MKRHLCGVHAVGEALASNPRSVALILVTDDTAKSPHRAMLSIARNAGVNVEARDSEHLDSLSGGLRHQGIVAIAGGDYPYVEIDAVLARANDPALLVILDEITDVHNFGAIVRSSVALGADGIVTLRDRAAPVTAAVVRSSAGATEHARIARVTNLSRAMEDLHERGFASVGLDAASEHTLSELDLTVPLMLVVGSEGRGLRRLIRERCTYLAKIPMSGRIASLNASVAAAIALYEVSRQRSAAT